MKKSNIKKIHFELVDGLVSKTSHYVVKPYNDSLFFYHFLL